MAIQKKTTFRWLHSCYIVTYTKTCSTHCVQPTPEDMFWQGYQYKISVSYQYYKNLTLLLFLRIFWYQFCQYRYRYESSYQDRYWYSNSPCYCYRYWCLDITSAEPNNSSNSALGRPFTNLSKNEELVKFGKKGCVKNLWCHGIIVITKITKDVFRLNTTMMRFLINFYQRQIFLHLNWLKK